MGSPSPAGWAEFYAASAGWRSFPVKPGEKSPMFSGWQQDATTDPELIRRYWNGPEGYERNLGLVCGDHFEAWDIERAHVGRFNEWMTANGWSMPECPLAQTGRGGIHLLTAPTVGHTRYLYLDGVHIGELKSTGGFILACPSETEDLYRWLWLPDDLSALPEAPDWLRGLLERPVALRKWLPGRIASVDDVENALGRLAGSVRKQGEGSRNSYLYWAMRRAIEEGLPIKFAVRALTAAAHDAGLNDEEDEISKTIESAIRAESVAA